MPKNLLITGASSGIGRALAREMAGRGYALALTARREAVLAELQQELTARHPGLPVAQRPLDVAASDTVAPTLEELAADLGGLDIVVANAGVGHGEKVGYGRFAQARETVATNLLGAMATVDAAVAHFRSRGGGHVVGISSVAAFRGLPRSGSYSASKAGLAIYLEALRAEVYGTGIHVTVLYPGYIDTPLNAMLPRRPFVIPVERGAALIADGIERRVARATVPAFPWSLLAPLLRRLPTRLAARL